jgi:uncharacterized protein DUF4399
MKKLKLILSLSLIFGLFASASYAGDTQAVVISKPRDGATVSSPVEVCMTPWGIEFEPAKKGVNEGKGHNHILVDVALPSDLSKPIGKDANHIHMGDGSSCKTIKLSRGKHTIRILFAKGNHIPYNPPISDTIVINVQ